MPGKYVRHEQHERHLLLEQTGTRRCTCNEPTSREHHNSSHRAVTADRFERSTRFRLIQNQPTLCPNTSIVVPFRHFVSSVAIRRKESAAHGLDLVYANGIPRIPRFILVLRHSTATLKGAITGVSPRAPTRQQRYYCRTQRHYVQRRTPMTGLPPWPGKTTLPAFRLDSDLNPEFVLRSQPDWLESGETTEYRIVEIAGGLGG